ncbi:hypothetical protein CG428_21785 [Pantoea ananatis]|nr:hypothetical protein CG428_21785 [Pantoea ananatis]
MYDSINKSKMPYHLPPADKAIGLPRVHNPMNIAWETDKKMLSGDNGFSVPERLNKKVFYTARWPVIIFSKEIYNYIDMIVLLPVD